MVRVSIISLIYQSTKLADWVYYSIQKYTPMIQRGEAEFFFVANDPSNLLLQHLQEKKYPYIININKKYTAEDLFRAGYGTPEYMSRVYRGYNEGAKASKGDYVVLVNSDNFFSPDWLENLLKYSDRQLAVSSKLVERKHPKFDIFPGAIHGEFGSTVDNFSEKNFIQFAQRIKQTGLEKGGAYMPSLLHKDVLIEAGLYPTGNVAGEKFEIIKRYGDEALFDALSELGVEHVTALDSLVYHLKEGERDDAINDAYEEKNTQQISTNKNVPTEILVYPQPSKIIRVFYRIDPTKRHAEIIATLLGQRKKIRHGVLGKRNLLEIIYNLLKTLHLIKPAKTILKFFTPR